MSKKKGKRFQEAMRKFDRTAYYPVREAFDLAKSTANAKFDETVEVAFRLGIDARKADQAVRGTVSLPHGVGKDVRVAVFAQGDNARAAEAAGADVVGADDLLERIQGGFLDFDVAIASPDMMSKVGRLGKLLGPRGLMPNPKSGTVTPNVADAVREFKAGRTEYRNDRYGNVHLGIGKASFPVENLVGNYVAAVDELQRVKPASAKGRYFRGIVLATTMSPGVRVDHHNPLPEID